MAFLDSRRPLRSLVTAFFAWKSILFLIALGSGIGPAYDTSTTLVSTAQPSSTEDLLDLPTRLTRWDAIYFIQAARRGYQFEQEWAFGPGLPTVIAFITNGLARLGVRHSHLLVPFVGLVVSNASHLFSVLVLYQLGLVVWGSFRVPWIAALLHVLSPAGIFLSAPYAESSFALLSFVGYLFFAKALRCEQPTFGHDVSLVASGLWFGFAATFRSNGILHGIPFAVELLRELQSPPNLRSIRRRMALIIGGSAIAFGFALPQFSAYQLYCSGTARRQWCSNLPPSIYTFVQAHYWNVGFLRYWTPGNIPLFLLAAPMLYLLAKSGSASLSNSTNLAVKHTTPRTQNDLQALVRSMALTQLILVILAVTTYHIQIITRLSSAYPLWYWWLSSLLVDSKTSRFGSNFVAFCAMYAGIQGALFTSFLPPA